MLLIRLYHLHSTMYLFQPLSSETFSRRNVIYIPLCIYFNQRIRQWSVYKLSIYIPLCIYFNNRYRNIKQIKEHIYIPLCIYFNPVLYSPALIQQLHLLFCRSLSLYRFYHKFLLVITSFSHIRLCNLY